MPDAPVALVTEANKGIGLQIARGLAGHGLTVLVGARRAVELALPDTDGPTGTLSDEDGPVPW